MYSELVEEQSYEIDAKIHARQLPQVIYKFRIWNDSPNDHILKKQTIRLASPFELQADYSETILPINESVITEVYMQKVALNEAILNNPEADQSTIENIAKEIRPKLTLDIREEREWAYGKIRERNNETKGVFCASYTSDHLDQWTYMADNGKGFVVGLNFKNIYLKEEVFGIAKCVQYYPADKIPMVEPYSFTAEERLEKSLQEIFSVPNKYSYEREFRIVRTNHRYDSFGQVAAYTEHERIIKLNVDDYVEILLGFDISDQDRNEIIDICSRFLPTIPVFETEIRGGKVGKSGRIR